MDINFVSCEWHLNRKKLVDVSRCESNYDAIRKLGVKVKIKNKICKIYGVGIEGYKYKKGITINAQNSGTLGRLISGLLVNSRFL